MPQPLQIQFRALTSVLVAFSFWCAFVAPEWLHGAIHAVTQVEHVSETNPAVDAISAQLLDACEFMHVLASSQKSAYLPSVTAPVYRLPKRSSPGAWRSLSCPESLAHLKPAARGPPHAFLI